jgi:putative two-component system response regulator
MNYKILLIADEQKTIEILNNFLVTLNYDISTVKSEDLALKKINSETFSLVLCDVTTTGLNTLAILSGIKKNNSNLPVIVLSEFNNYDIVIKSLVKGASDFLTKPINQERLNKIINRHLDHQNEENTEYYSPATNLMRESHLFILNILNETIELKESYLEGHSKRVAEYSTKIAEALKLSPNDIEIINYAAQLHDLGKIGVSDAILLKTNKLTKEDWEEIKMHSVIGSDIVSRLKVFHDEEALIRHHHEWYDGSGYPDGLKKETIPLGARIIMIADAYDAMTSTRPYRIALSPIETRQIIQENAGNQFDPHLVETFLKIV